MAVAGLVYIYTYLAEGGMMFFMGVRLDGCKDVVVKPFPNPDDPRLSQVHKKGFVQEMRELSDEEAEEWADLYVAWYMRKLRKMPVLWSSSSKTVRVCMPKTRSHRSDYYAWVRWLPLPEGGYWYLLTLTFYRSISQRVAHANVNRWVSKFLHRFRNYMRSKYGVDLTYVWVVEEHKDGWPHVHILFRMPFIQELNIKALVALFYSWWVDDDGNPLCAFNGVDLEYIGRNYQRVRDYVLKYLVKQHSAYWGFKLLPNGLVAYRRSTTWLWLYKVRLFGMSQDIRAKLKEMVKQGGKNATLDFVFYGTISANRFHKLRYKPAGIPFEYWLENMPEVCYVECSDDWLPVLVPSAFGSRVGVDVCDGLIENF